VTQWEAGADAGISSLILTFLLSDPPNANPTLRMHSNAVQARLLKSGVAVEKLHFLQNSRNLGDRKCLLGKPRKSFVGHPNAILFLRISREGVFQQPQAITLKTLMGKPVRVSA